MTSISLLAYRHMVAICVIVIASVNSFSPSLFIFCVGCGIAADAARHITGYPLRCHWARFIIYPVVPVYSVLAVSLFLVAGYLFFPDYCSYSANDWIAMNISKSTTRLLNPTDVCAVSHGGWLMLAQGWLPFASCIVVACSFLAYPLGHETRFLPRMFDVRVVLGKREKARAVLVGGAFSLVLLSLFQWFNFELGATGKGFVPQNDIFSFVLWITLLNMLNYFITFIEHNYRPDGAANAESNNE